MISNRLNEIVNLINRDQNIADIGSDHGYVLIELRKRGFKSKLLGVENKKAPFLHLKNNIALYSNINIECDLSDGLDNVSSDYKTIIIAGMGFQTISEIINKNIQKLDAIDTFVIDSHTDKAKVRPFFISLGYRIGDEKVIYEDGIYYDVIRFEKSDNVINYSKEEKEFGPFNIQRKDDVFIKMVQDEIYYNNSILEKIKNTKAAEKINSLNNRNLYLMELIKK